MLRRNEAPAVTRSVGGSSPSGRAFVREFGASERLKGAFGEDWPLIWATRNRIAHGYATIDLGMIKATVRDDLPAFRSSIARALEQS